jgi:hypothetical protein
MSQCVVSFSVEFFITPNIWTSCKLTTAPENCLVIFMNLLCTKYAKERCAYLIARQSVRVRILSLPKFLYSFCETLY